MRLCVRVRSRIAIVVKSLTEYLRFEVPGRRGFINITPMIEELASRSGVAEGLCLVNAMHITASVFINDDESGVAPGLRSLAGEAGAARAHLRPAPLTTLICV